MVEIGDIISCEFKINDFLYKGVGEVANIEYVRGQKRCYAFWKWNDGTISYGYMPEEKVKIIKKYYKREMTFSSFSIKEPLEQLKKMGIRNKYIQEMEKKYGV